jgi:hypothetical protein
MLRHMARHKVQGYLNLAAEGFYEPKEFKSPHSADSTEDEDLHKGLGEDSDEVLDANRAYGDVNDYDSEDNRLLDTFVADYPDTSNCAEADADNPQEIPDALLPSSKASREVTQSYNDSLRVLTQYRIYCYL